MTHRHHEKRFVNPGIFHNRMVLKKSPFFNWLDISIWAGVSDQLIRVIRGGLKDFYDSHVRRRN